MKTLAIAVAATLAVLASSSAWAQSDQRFRDQLHCPMDSLHYGMTVLRDIRNCYKPTRRNDGPVYRGYENPNGKKARPR
jgi:hypothetical protein